MSFSLRPTVDIRMTLVVTVVPFGVVVLDHVSVSRHLQAW